MKTWTIELLTLLVLASTVFGAEKTPEEIRQITAQLKDQIAGWVADDPKDMPATLTIQQKGEILGNKKKILQAIPEKLSVMPSKKHKILVITLVHSCRAHVDSQGAMLAILHHAAKKTDAFEPTDITEVDLVKVTAETLKEFNAVVINNNFPFMENPDLGADGAAKMQSFCDELLPNYVRGGGGLFVYHWGIIYSKGGMYNRMVGTCFGGHPPGDGEICPLKVDGLQYVLGDLKVDDLPIAQSSDGKTQDLAPTAKTP